jgi:hypothetical protein
MIDSMTIFCPNQWVPSSRLGDATISGMGFEQRRLGSLRVKTTAEGTTIRGSLPKYLFGNNVATLDRDGLAAALTRLEEESGLDLTKSRVFQVEVGTTLHVERAPSEYMAAWASISRTRKSTISDGDTVQFSNRTWSFIGYDKKKEVGAGPLPEGWGAGYGLRLELQLRRGLTRKFGESWNPWQIAEGSAFQLLVNEWGSKYHAIKKVPLMDAPTGDITPRRLDHYFAAVGISTLGIDRANSLITSMRAEGAIDRKQASRIRATIDRRIRDGHFARSDILTEEIDEKVNDIIKTALGNSSHA